MIQVSKMSKALKPNEFLKFFDTRWNMNFEYFDSETEALLNAVCKSIEQDAEVANELAKIEQELSEN